MFISQQIGWSVKLGHSPLVHHQHAVAIHYCVEPANGKIGVSEVSMCERVDEVPFKSQLTTSNHCALTGFEANCAHWLVSASQQRAMASEEVNSAHWLVYRECAPDRRTVE